MKKLFRLLLALALICMVAACEKEEIKPDTPDTQDTVTPDNPEPPAPAVTITVDNVAAVEVTCSFTMSDTCSSYFILGAEAGTTEAYMPMFGFQTVAEAVEGWGLEYTENTTYTWDELNPNTQFVIYVLARCTHGDTLITDTVLTQTLGGHGTSSISVSVSDVTSTQVTTTATPNDQTALFKDFVILKDFYDEIGRDSVINLLKEDFYVYYSTDVWTWPDLQPSTEYYFAAIGQNADGVWGEMSMVSFTTAASKQRKVGKSAVAIVKR